MYPTHRHSRFTLLPRGGFTLVELLIVVGIIAILAAIAIPNFLEAQMRSKVTRTKADMRSLATAVESYRVDHNAYHYRQNTNSPQYLPEYSKRAEQMAALTTPIAYMTGFVTDIFETVSKPPLNIIDYWDPQQTALMIKNFHALRPSRWLDPGVAGWMMVSVGPDGYLGQSTNVPESGGAPTYPRPADPILRNQLTATIIFPYDPTNGTYSFGNIYNGQVGGTDGAGRILFQRLIP